MVKAWSNENRGNRSLAGKFLVSDDRFKFWRKCVRCGGWAKVGENDEHPLCIGCSWVTKGDRKNES